MYNIKKMIIYLQKNMIDIDQNYLVIWASNNKEKYWYKVFNDLISNWYNAIPVNPKEKEILNQKVYNNILDFKWKIDNVIFVTQPEVTEDIIQCIIDKKLDIEHIWMQPGSESDRAILLCKKNNIPYINNSCIMIERKQ